MNVITKIRLLNEVNAKELRLGVTGTKSSWHNQYKDSAWVYVGSLPYELSEGDVICVLSQYGEIMNINMIRDKKTGKSKGFAFVCYEDQRSTILAVDNLNGTKIKGRQIRVDHIMDYKVPKEDEEIDELTMKIREKGVAPHVMGEYQEPEVEQVEVKQEVEEIVITDSDDEVKEKKKKHKKEKKKKKGLSFLKETPSDKLKKHKHKESDSRKKSTNSDEERNVERYKHKRSHDSSDDDVQEKRSKNKDVKRRSSVDLENRQKKKKKTGRRHDDDGRQQKTHRYHEDDRRERKKERSVDRDRDRKHRRRRSRSR
uniref:RNA-binding motif protein, X-linked 2 n=1 Tax=Phallusia mammillata TaxID=59560 RepID=A0A6F9DPW9_9ASCI|nr:RNA-binding motif protein, X-linked 2 [Phallusia mammillata]